MRGFLAVVAVAVGSIGVAQIGGGGGSQDQIVVFWSSPGTWASGTYNQITVTADIGPGAAIPPGGGVIGSIIECEGEVYKIVSIEMLANAESMETQQDSGETPPPWTMSLPVVYSSLHWDHNALLSFTARITWELEDGTQASAEVGGPSVTTYNRSVSFAIDDYAFGYLALELLLNLNQDLLSRHDNSWNEADFLSALAGRTMSSLYSHGGTYDSGEGYQIPPNDFRDIKAADINPVVQTTVANGFPSMHVSFLMGCKAGSDSAYALSWLSGAPTTIDNRAVIGFKISPLADEVERFLVDFAQLTLAGKTVYQAALEAWADEWNEGVLDEVLFKQDIAIHGDPAARIKFVYDAQVSSVHTEWARKGP